jgi:general L-amino acid transport system substrate-binding protein
MPSFKYVMIAASTLVSLALNANAGTLEDVQARGHLNCGVGTPLPGLSFKYEDGRRGGLQVDTCRAVAAAALGDASKIVFSEFTLKDSFTALQAADVDLLDVAMTWTQTRDTAFELNFAATTLYDGQGIMVRKDLGLSSARELDGAKICVPIGTTTERNLLDFFRTHGMDLEMVRSANASKVADDFESGKCDAVSNDRTILAAFRAGSDDPAAYLILPDILSKEPVGPVVRHGDDQWFDVVKWTVFALIQAEESGVTSQNVDEMVASEDPTIQRLLGVSGDMGRQMGLSGEWAYQIVKQVGNYGEVYDRNVGPNTPLGLERGLNALWTDGGLMYAMPFR